jgi:putative flippase GtrA
MFLGVSALVANAIGYFLGAFLSYYLNKKYTFKSKGKNHSEAIKFFMVLGISYALNFIALQWLLNIINPYYAQLIAAIVYTLSAFVLAKFFVFKDTNDS